MNEQVRAVDYLVTRSCTLFVIYANLPPVSCRSLDFSSSAPCLPLLPLCYRKHPSCTTGAREGWARTCRATVCRATGSGTHHTQCAVAGESSSWRAQNMQWNRWVGMRREQWDSNVEVLEFSTSLKASRRGGSGEGSSKITGQLDRGLMQLVGNERQECGVGEGKN
jgi:hypothetical protein